MTDSSTTSANPNLLGTSTLVIGTRGSALALWQANTVKALLETRFPRESFALKVIRPEGDIDKQSSLLKIGGRGVFASALQEALLKGTIDIAVHSTKDVPTIEPAGLVIAAFPERDDARDAVVSRHGVGLAGLPDGPVIGTSSRRRAVQVEALRPDATIVDLRGNIDTRLRKAESTAFDAVILAAAGLTRMGWQDRITEYLPFDRFVPSPGQGALAIETRIDPDPAYEIAHALDQCDVSRAVRIERDFLRAMGGGCTTPIGAHAQFDGDTLHVWAMIASDDGSRLARRSMVVPQDQAGQIVSRLVPEMIEEVRENGSASVGLANPRPLAGRQVLVTGTRRMTHRLELAFSNEGAHPIKAPTLDILPSSTPDELERALGQLERGEFAWLVITSQESVPALVTFGAARLNGKTRIAAVGASTASAIRDIGLHVDLVPDNQTGPGLVAAFANIGIDGETALCLLGSTAADTVPEGLADLGAIVTRVESYESRPIPELDDDARQAVRAGRVDLVIFTSPLSVTTLTSLLGADLAALSGACLVAIGPATQAAMERANLPVHGVADQPTPEALVSVCSEYFGKRSGMEAFQDDNQDE